MSRIADAFGRGKVFVAYLMAGDPSLAHTREFILEMERAGAGIIELGIPFSDPIAEGETIQGANLRAMASGTDMRGAFRLAASLKGELSAPLLFMTYANPVFAYGYGKFFAECAECGVSGVILPDMPFEEQGELSEHADRSGVDVITLVAPTSGERAVRIARAARGYLYLVSSMGVTGARDEIDPGVQARVSEIKRCADIPVAVGFGIHSPSQAAELSRFADGVIVGSAIVDIIARNGESAAGPLADYVRLMKAAMDAAEPE
ncbi:MAG: tryptophan synthase subunit alpha [Clostridiales Family XIII bacterium]|jgi:tryptophan synthase alpha chain|nr:tryptophan synthase subunit alpha [Clostridiales Family XIII bacterium]